MPIDLNCDLGEGCPSDAELMPLITSANVCCGAHAGGEAEALAALRLAREHGVQAGAHPGFPDREHFGRRELPWAEGEVAGFLGRQLDDLRRWAEAAGVPVRYVKPHGALYNMACRDEALARVVARVAERYGLALMALPGSRLQEAAAGRVPFVAEGFADRRYRPDGSLVPRGSEEAFVHDPDEAVRQARWLLAERGVRTLCVHGDNPRAVVFVRALRQALVQAGLDIRPFALP
jgi:5-oxoprolinase (ATP-hydrolysing) subunit A